MVRTLGQNYHGEKLCCCPTCLNSAWMGAVGAVLAVLSYKGKQHVEDDLLDAEYQSPNFKLLRSRGIDSKESIAPEYVARDGIHSYDKSCCTGLPG